MNVPGPGQYNGAKSTENLGCSIKQRHESSMTSKYQASIPGPGQYDPDFKAGRPNTAG